MGEGLQSGGWARSFFSSKLDTETACFLPLRFFPDQPQYIRSTTFLLVRRPSGRSARYVRLVGLDNASLVPVQVEKADPIPRVGQRVLSSALYWV